LEAFVVVRLLMLFRMVGGIVVTFIVLGVFAVRDITVVLAIIVLWIVCTIVRVSLVVVRSWKSQWLKSLEISIVRIQRFWGKHVPAVHAVLGLPHLAIARDQPGSTF
jgi:hypothetical protein